MRIVREASPQTVESGMQWYSDAMELCMTLDPSNPRRAAGVVAALSPLKSWKANKNLARSFYEGNRGGTFGDAIRKAERIYNGEDPLDVLPKGKKTHSFFLNITGDDSVVTLDRHAVDIAVGHTMSDDERMSYLKSVKRSNEIADSYRKAARIFSREYGMVVKPYQVQAITWVHWRQYYAQAYHGRGE